MCQEYIEIFVFCNEIYQQPKKKKRKRGSTFSLNLNSETDEWNSKTVKVFHFHFNVVWWRCDEQFLRIHTISFLGYTFGNWIPNNKHKYTRRAHGYLIYRINQNEESFLPLSLIMAPFFLSFPNTSRYISTVANI